MRRYFPTEGPIPADVTRDSLPRASTMRSPSGPSSGSLPPVGKRARPEASAWASMVSVRSTAAGSVSRASRYAARPMKSARFTRGRARPASTGEYSDVSSAPMRAYPFSMRPVVP